MAGAGDLLRTPLAGSHEALGARMAPFAGWLMPIQYAGIVAEHTHTRDAAGLFDLSHMGRLTVTGPDAVHLLQYATTNDVTRLDEGAIQYTLICNERGGVLEDLLVYRCPDTWRLVVNASNRVRVIQVLDAIIEERRFRATVHDDTFALALLAVQGPQSADVLQPLVEGDVSTLAYYHARDDWLTTLLVPPPRSDDIALPGPESPARHDVITGHDVGGDRTPILLSRTGYTGEDGFEVIISAAAAPVLWGMLLSDERVRPTGLGARDTLRLEAGMALYGHELSEDVTPYEARLGRVVRLDKGPFRGSNALAGLKERSPMRRLVGLRFGPGAVPRAGYRVRHGTEDVGEIASGTFSPTLRLPIATAYVRTDCAEDGVELQISIRDTYVPAHVVSLPFVPHHTKRAKI
jgi:aminomethyltransferase